MADEFYKACIPDPVHVLGFKLRPLSLGHIIILHRIDSPFVSGKEFDLSDLASAVLICSLTYKEAIETILDPDLDRGSHLGYRALFRFGRHRHLL